MKKLLCYLLSFSLFCACNSSENNPLPISGKWKVQSLDDKDVSKFNATLNINAPQNSASGTSGCNLFNGNGTIDSVKMTIKLNAIITTKIGCLNELGVFEQNYYNALNNINAYQFDNKTLILTVNKVASIKLVQ